MRTRYRSLTIWSSSQHLFLFFSIIQIVLYFIFNKKKFFFLLSEIFLKLFYIYFCSIWKIQFHFAVNRATLVRLDEHTTNFNCVKQKLTKIYCIPYVYGTFFYFQIFSFTFILCAMPLKKISILCIPSTLCVKCKRYFTVLFLFLYRFLIVVFFFYFPFMNMSSNACIVRKANSFIINMLQMNVCVCVCYGCCVCHHQWGWPIQVDCTGPQVQNFATEQEICLRCGLGGRRC